MPGLMSYFGWGNSTSTGPPEKITTRALPAPWYTSDHMYQLERRAIFSKRWMFITHKSRLAEPGDFLKYEVAGYGFVISKDRKGEINAFHNVCRHRAYPFVEKECGKASIFACRYHGWSYGLDGRLAKAPNYQDIPGFDKSKNGLLPIHVHVDANGFIWVNLDTKETPEVSWEESFDNVDKQERFNELNFDDYMLDHTYENQGEFNWKILSDNFNECYHCPTTHPDIPNFLEVGNHTVETKDGHMQHDHASPPEQKAKGLNVYSTYYFPNVSMSVSPHFLMIQKFLPDGPSKSSMHYEIFRNKNSSDEDFHLIADMYARVMSEDKELCRRQQKNLNAGVIVNGELHPRWEKGPLFFQQTCREVVTEHYRREKAAGHEIWPARQQLPDTAYVSQEDLEICNGLSCSTPQEVMAW